MSEGLLLDLDGVVPLRVPRPGEQLIAERRTVRLDEIVAEWMLESLLARDLAPGGEDAHGYLVRWVDEETRGWALHALHLAGLNPSRVSVRIGLTDRCDVDPAEWETFELAPRARPEPDPVFAALDTVEDAQAALQAAEARRVTAAHAAWRAALAEEGDPTASGTAYQRGFFTDLAHKLKIAPTTAAALVHTADDLQTATPLVWAEFTAGRTGWRVLQTVHVHLAGLDPAHHAAFDTGAVRKIREVTPTGLPDALRRLRERLQAATADQRHEQAAARRHVRIEPAADGMAWLHAYLPATDTLAIDHQLTGAATTAARRPGETRGIGQLRADILTDVIHATLRRPSKHKHKHKSKRVLVPHRRGVEPRIAILIPALTALGHTTAPATLQGYGPIGTTTALRLAGTARSWIRVLTDPVDGAILTLARTRYRPSRHMRTLLHLLDGGSRGPGTPRPPGQTEIDHVHAYTHHHQHGHTAITNLALLSPADHRLKTIGGATYHLLPDRTTLWHTPTGATITTRPVDPPEPTPTPPHPPPRPPLLKRSRHAARLARHRRGHCAPARREGARVIVAHLDLGIAESVVERLPGSGHVARRLDVLDSESAAAVVDGTALDALVHVAGGDTAHGPFESTADETWRAMLDLNLLGPVRTIRAALPALRAGTDPSVVLVGSVNAELPLGSEPYSAAKAGLTSLISNLAAQEGPRGVRVNAVAPGTIRTRVWEGRSPDRLAPRYPLRRIGEPDDVAAAIAFLASRDAAWITGVVLPVDGGLRLVDRLLADPEP